MQRKTKRTITVVLVLISVLLLLSPIVFAKVFWKIDDVGLKSVHIRADIYEEGLQGPKMGRMSASIRELEPQLYSYKLVVSLRKAMENEVYDMHMYADLPSDLSFTIYGDTNDPLWNFLESVAVTYLKIDLDPEIPGQIRTTVGLLGLTGYHEQDTGIDLITDIRGNNKTTKTGVWTEDYAMEFALDLAWPIFRAYLQSEIPGLELPSRVDFADLGIIGFTMHGGTFEISMGARFVGQYDSYRTEDIVIDRTWNDFIWWA